MPSDKENEEGNIMANGTNLDSPPPNSGHTSHSVRSPLERKELLRSFLRKTQALTDCTKQTMLTLDEIGKEIDLINLEVSIDEKACCQDEVLMDSQIMTASSHVLQKASTMLTKELCPYDYREFADKLKKYVFKLPDSTLETPPWPLFAPEVVNCFKRTPNFSALSGCLIPLEKKVVVKRQPGKRDPLAPTSRPEAIVNVEKEDDSVEETVQRIKLLISNHLKKTGKPIEFFRLILDPVEFGKTVENLLHVAFLIRDGMIKLQDDEAGEPVVVPCSKEMRAAAKRDKIPNTQNVVALEFNEWQALVKLHRIERAMIDFT